MYLEMVPEARKIVYLITNKFEKIENPNLDFNNVDSLDYEIGDLFREEYTKDLFSESIDSILHKFESWLKAYNLFGIYEEKWKCK